MPLVTRIIADSVAEALTAIEAAAALIDNGTGGKPEVASIAANLVTIWGLVERDPGVQSAALDVFEAAATLSAPEEPPGLFRLRRLLRDAVVRLRKRVSAARPNASAVPVPGELRSESDAKAA